MSKYNALWKYIKENDGETLTMTFEQIEKVVDFKINHAFLNYKKELLDYGFKVGKISMKNKTVNFDKIK